MTQVCPKCSYTRKPVETVPDWQCPSCGIAYAKFQQGDQPASGLPARDGGVAQSMPYSRMFLFFMVAAILAIGYFGYEKLGKSRNPLPGESRNPSLSAAGAPWEEVSIADFDSRVLGSSLPVLVYFDAVEGCDGADIVFSRLRQKWGKQLNVFYFKAESNPEFARTYGVDENVVFALFKDGRMAKRIDAPTFLRPLLGPNNQVSSLEAFYADFLAALERFANLR